MKVILKTITCLIIIFSIASCVPNQQLAVEEYQRNLAGEWSNPETTPLHEEEKEKFQGITFFPIDNKYRVKAEVTLLENGEIIPFPTSANKIKNYKESAKLNFKIDGKDFELTAYEPSPVMKDYPGYLFIPFTDDTNNETTYGGGRYLEIYRKDIKKGKVILDFNKAYNPYCAYSVHYNCPIPPANNYLETEIKAGVSYLSKH